MPPTNHLAKGGFQSSTFFQGVNQVTFSLAILAQKRFGLLLASLRYCFAVFLFQFAWRLKSGVGLNVRFSFNSDSISGISGLSFCSAGGVDECGDLGTLRVTLSFD